MCLGLPLFCRFCSILLDAEIIVYIFCPGLLSDSVPPVQTAVAVCAGYGTGGYAAAPGLVWDSVH